MSVLRRKRLEWVARPDGAQWAAISIKGASGIATVVQLPTGSFEVMFACELKGTWASAADAKRAVEEFLGDVLAATKKHRNQSSFSCVSGGVDKSLGHCFRSTDRRRGCSLVTQGFLYCYDDCRQTVTFPSTWVPLVVLGHSVQHTASKKKSLTNVRLAAGTKVGKGDRTRMA